MNIFFYALIIFVLVYLVLNWFTKTSSKKIANNVRTLIIILSIIFAVIVAYAGRFIFSLPFILFVLPLIKTKAGLSLIQLFRIWSLLRILKRSGRFSFEQNNNVQSSGTMSVVEAYKILNLDFNKKYNKKEINKAHKKIISKVHPDISPETTRLASIVNEARDTILKNL
jgi:flagellar motor component MotA